MIDGTMTVSDRRKIDPGGGSEHDEDQRQIAAIALNPFLI
jgi:hypothetical protein